MPQYLTNEKSLATVLAVSVVVSAYLPNCVRPLQPMIEFACPTAVLGFVSITACLFFLSILRIRQIPK
jgi:hypothetical protein